MGTESRISVRISAELKKRLEEAKKTTGLDEPTIVKHCVEAFCRYVEHHGESSSFPLELRAPRAGEIESLSLMAAEQPVSYRPKKRHNN